jgi:hypothetical protein
VRVREALLYCGDHLADAADGKADRTFRRIVNEALSDLSAAHPWTRYQGSAQIPLSIGVSGTAVTIAQDDNVLTFGATSQVLPRYLAEKWRLTITGESTLGFQLGAIDSSTQARLASAQKWIATAAAAAAHVWTRTIYPLPDGCKKIRELALASSRVPLTLVLPAELDALRWDNPTETGTPDQFAVREREIEVWPPLGPSGTRDALQLAYDRQPAVLTEQSDVDAELDFDPRWPDLVEAAIDVVLATKHPKESGLSFAVTSARFMRRLEKAKGEDSARGPRPTTFGLGLTVDRETQEALRFRRIPHGTDP